MSKLKKQVQEIELVRPTEFPPNHPVRLNLTLDFEVVDMLMDYTHSEGGNRSRETNMLLREVLSKKKGIPQRPPKVREKWLNKIK